MPAYQVKCNFTRTVTLIVEAPNEQAVYDVTAGADFDPDVFPCEDEVEDWDSADPIEIEPAPEYCAEPMIRVSEDGTRLEII